MSQYTRGLNLSSSQGPSQGVGRDFGKVTYTLLYLKWITNKNLLYSTQNSAQCYVLAWMGLRGVWGRTDIGTWTAESLYSSPETITTLFIDYEVTQSCPTLCDPMDYTAHQAPLSMEFSRQEYWSGLPFPSPRH